MANTVFIAPSILNANFDNLENEIAKISTTADLLHLDIMDNKFVPNFTFDIKRAFEIISFSKLPVDAHLMIEDPDSIAPRYAQTGCNSVTFHLEAASDVLQTISDIKSNGAKVGIAIKPATKFSEVEPFIEKIDMLLIMTVEPGFGGQSFMENQMAKVAQVRTALNSVERDIWLQVDGGISLETIEIATRAGADTFVAGSAVYKADDPAEMVRKLRLLAEKSTEQS